MIENEEQLAQAREAEAHLENALRALRARVYESNPELFYAMAEDYSDSISEIRADVDAYLGLTVAQTKKVPLWMTLKGETLRDDQISSRLLTDWLEKLRKAIYGIAAYWETGLVRVGRPIAALMEITDPKVMVLKPGSINVGLRLPDQTIQAEFFENTPEESISHRALARLLYLSDWAAHGGIELPEISEDTRDEITVVARYAASLAPSERSQVQVVEFSGSLVPTELPIPLTVEAKSRLEGLVGLLTVVNEEEIRGQIREIDLDKQRIILRERGEGMPDVRCNIPEGLMTKAEELLHHWVIVRGNVSSGSPEVMDVTNLFEDKRGGER